MAVIGHASVLGVQTIAEAVPAGADEHGLPDPNDDKREKHRRVRTRF